MKKLVSQHLVMDSNNFIRLWCFAKNVLEARYLEEKLDGIEYIEYMEQVGIESGMIKHSGTTSSSE